MRTQNEPFFGVTFFVEGPKFLSTTVYSFILFIITDMNMETGLQLGSLLLYIGSQMRDLT